MDNRRSRKLLCVAMVFFWASEYCHSPYFTPYLESLGFGAAAIGVMTGIYGFTQMFVRVPMGIITDAFSCYKATILFGTIATTVSSFFLMFATSMWSILLCRIIAGFAASTWLAFSVLYNAYYASDESVTAMTNANAFSNGGKLLAFFLGIMTASRWGYRVPLLCSFLTGLVAIFAVLLLKPIQIKHESFSFKHIVGIVKNPLIIAASFFAILLQFYMQGTVFSFTSGFAESLGASSFLIGLISLSFTLIQVLSAPFVGKSLLKKLKSYQALFLGFILMAVAAVIIAFTSSPWIIVGANIFAGFANLMTNGLLMALAVKSVPDEEKSTAMGFFQAVYGIGMTLGPVITGRLVAARGYSFSYIVVTILMLFAAFSAYFAVRKADKCVEKR